MINCLLKTVLWFFCHRVAREAKHPNIATYFDILEGPNHFFIIMEAASLYAHTRDSVQPRQQKVDHAVQPWHAQTQRHAECWSIAILEQIDLAWHS